MARDQAARSNRTEAAPRARGGLASTETLAVVGLGKPGLSLLIRAARKGFRVIGFDFDEVRIAQLQVNADDFLDTEDAALVKSAADLTLSSEESALRKAEIFAITTPAPLRQRRSADLSALESAAATVAKYLTEGAHVIIESVVPIGACENIVLPILTKGSKLGAEQFSFAHCPIREMDRPLSETPRVFGARGDEALRRTRDFYHTLLDSDLIAMRSIKEAEAVPLLISGALEVESALVNELSVVFDKIGIDILNVIEGAAADPAFFPRYPSSGDPSRIAGDPFYLVRYGRDKGFEHQLLTAARRVNSRMPHYAIRVLADSLNEKNLRIDGASIALLGITAARDASDLSESPALEIRDELQKRGAKVKIFDPFAAVYSERSLEAALEGADAAIIATDHSVFRTLSPKVFETAKVRIVIDGHNRLDRRAFEESTVLYKGIGRG